jgi:hypothetical protein
MPVVKLSKKELTTLAHASDLQVDKFPSKTTSNINKKITKALRTYPAVANDKGKKDAVKVKVKKLQPVTQKLIGRKAMRKALEELIRKEEIKHVTKPEFLAAVAKRAAMLAESYQTFAATVPKAVEPTKAPAAKQA